MKCEYNEQFMSPPCIAGNQEQCISLSGTGKLFNHMTEIGKICRLYALVFSDSVCTTTKSDLGEELWALTPPCEALGLCDSLGDFFFTHSNLNLHHHALGILTDQLVQEGMLLDATTAVEVVRQRDEAADQEHPAVDHVKLE